MRSPAGALGHFQFMPGTWATYGGGGSPFDLGQSAMAASRYMSKLLTEFGGNIAMALAGYNWGEGNVERDRRRWGSAWREHLPNETKGYLEKILPHIGAQSPAVGAAAAGAGVVEVFVHLLGAPSGTHVEVQTRGPVRVPEIRRGPMMPAARTVEA